jgi:DNA topoisomerase-1
MMTDFYSKFHPRIEDVEENADRATGDRLWELIRKPGKMFMQESEDSGNDPDRETDDEEKPILHH